mmetsp:Transcript_89589/g.258443  ORF Transcript_89589/g.258443 Transcript_89589/m.258443 type:complete len:228 (-) Transcript_89589:98-781(-)
MVCFALSSHFTSSLLSHSCFSCKNWSALHTPCGSSKSQNPKDVSFEVFGSAARFHLLILPHFSSSILTNSSDTSLEIRPTYTVHNCDSWPPLGEAGLGAGTGLPIKGAVPLAGAGPVARGLEIPGLSGIIPGRTMPGTTTGPGALEVAAPRQASPGLTRGLMSGGGKPPVDVGGRTILPCKPPKPGMHPPTPPKPGLRMELPSGPACKSPGMLPPSVGGRTRLPGPS